MLVRFGWALFGVVLAFTAAFVSVRVLHLPRPCVVNCNYGEPELEFLRGYYDPDESVPALYATDAWHLVRDGSFGRSFQSGEDAHSAALRAVPATGALVLPGFALAALLALALAVPWSRAPLGHRYVLRVPLYIAIGVPPLWLALLLSKHVGFDLGWLPITGYCDFFGPQQAGCGGAVDWTEHLVLPWVAFGVFFAAIYVRIFRAVLRSARLAAPEDRASQARRARLVIARVLGRDFGFAMGAALIVERLFGIPGLGRGVSSGINSFDPYVVQTLLVYSSVLAIAVHFVVDVIVAALDADLRAEWPVAGMPVRT